MANITQYGNTELEGSGTDDSPRLANLTDLISAHKIKLIRDPFEMQANPMDCGDLRSETSPWPAAGCKASVFMVIGILLAVSIRFTGYANAHDTWINEGTRNSAGELCCGPGDCFEIPGDIMSMDGAGYWIGTLEHVPFSEVLPSPDGKFWRCRKTTGERRCFFAPRPTT